MKGKFLFAKFLFCQTQLQKGIKNISNNQNSMRIISNQITEQEQRKVHYKMEKILYT